MRHRVGSHLPDTLLSLPPPWEVGEAWGELVVGCEHFTALVVVVKGGDLKPKSGKVRYHPPPPPINKMRR